MKIVKMIISVYAWLTSRAGYMLFNADDRSLAAEKAGKFRRAWFGILVVSVIWSFACVGLWHLTITFANDQGTMSPVPAAAVLLPFVLWFYRRSILAMAKVCFPHRRDERTILIAMIVVMLLLFFLDVRGHKEEYWYHNHIGFWQWLRPRASYRPLLLGPLWGAWAMLITPQFSRANKNTEPAIAAMAESCGPAIAACSMALPLAGSLYYFNHLPWQVSISGLAILSATVGGFVICKATAGLKRRSLLAVNILTQLVFYFTYLVNRVFAGK